MTLRFRADNFEAVATRVGDSHFDGVTGPWDLFVLSGPGVTAYSLARHGGSVRVLTSDGWKPLLDTGFTAGALALAISLLYSVPGVEVCDE